ncbi:MAG: hypothetical protein EBY39_13670, partial [Flavobacteriia bacterium]|nr:hypothetical protein [Flavobacteriia bacterium]
ENYESHSVKLINIPNRHPREANSIEQRIAAIAHSNLNVSITYLRGLDVTELNEKDMPLL